MKKFKFIFVLIIIAACAIRFTGRSGADMIITNDGKETRGIVVEDYKDRLVFSTADGEMTVMKSEIRELLFDSEEDNLIKLAQQAADRRAYSKAMSYYEMALKVNPNSTVAAQGMVFLRGNIFRSGESNKAAAIKRQEEIESSGGAATIRSDDDEIRDMEKTLRETTGMTITMTETAPVVETVKQDTPAYEAGLRDGDRVISVWEKLTGYLSRKEILDLLINKSAVEIRSIIERVVSISINKNRTVIGGLEGSIGAQFAMELDGLTVASVRDEGPAIEGGLQKGDLVMAIDGQQTRYMSLKKAVELIQKSKEPVVKLTIRRKAIIWRRSEI